VLEVISTTLCCPIFEHTLFFQLEIECACTCMGAGPADCNF